MTVAQWNAANRRARDAYHDDPFALSDLLDREDRVRALCNAGVITPAVAGRKVQILRLQAGAV